MTHFSLKNAILLASVLSFSVGMSAFAVPAKVECTTNPLFAANTCEACYTEKFETTKTASWWTAELSTVKIPWEHGGGDLGEVILESAQDLPEIIPSADVIVTPVDPLQIWEFDTDIVWYEVGSDNEYYIEKWIKNNLYTLKTGVKLNVAGKWANDTALIKTNLAYEDYDVTMNESAMGKSRIICVLGDFSTGASATVTPPASPVIPPVVITPPVTPPADDLAPLDSAGPEEDVVITPEQTEPKSGPEFWIFLLLAFAFSGAWTAWKKQKA